MNVKSKLTISIPEMAWPNPDYGNETETEFSLSRKMCFGGHKNLSEQEIMYISSVLSAYKELFSKTKKQRDFIFTEIAAELSNRFERNQEPKLTYEENILLTRLASMAKRIRIFWISRRPRLLQKLLSIQNSKLTYEKQTEKIF